MRMRWARRAFFPQTLALAPKEVVLTFDDGPRPVTTLRMLDAGFASSPALLEWLERRGITVFGADLWVDDWNPISPRQELALALGRIEANHGGIVLLHDTKARTAAMLPALLHGLKVRRYRIVHVVSPAQGAN
jgi:peptidoglycan/xylan/chitin deacetylase (PgdA/CDA1 family)